MNASKLPVFWLALDFSTADEVRQVIEALRDVEGEYGCKINLDLFMREPTIVRWILEQAKRPVFVDMKMWNGPRTMTSVVESVADSGACMTNAYALADDLLLKAVKAAHSRGVMLLGVTVLTHYTEEYCKRVFCRPLCGTVRMLAEMALYAGCDGYILPGTTLCEVNDLSGIKFNPAVRPEWFQDPGANHQKQFMTPRDALLAGSNMISCGSPVFGSTNPSENLSRILREVNIHGLS